MSFHPSIQAQESILVCRTRSPRGLMTSAAARVLFMVKKPLQGMSSTVSQFFFCDVSRTPLGHDKFRLTGHVLRMGHYSGGWHHKMTRLRPFPGAETRLVHNGKWLKLCGRFERRSRASVITVHHWYTRLVCSCSPRQFVEGSSRTA